MADKSFAVGGWNGTAICPLKKNNGATLMKFIKSNSLNLKVLLIYYSSL